MHIAAAGWIGAITAVIAAAGPAGAVIVSGGGSPRTDCLVVFDAPANYPPGAPRQVRCVDGDPTCDSDAAVNGVCRVRVAVCANSTADAACAAAGVAQINVDHAMDNGTDAKFDPDFLAVRTRIQSELTFPLTAPDTCTSPVTLSVPIKGPLGKNSCSKRKKKLVLRSRSTGASGALADVDVLKIVCQPAPGDGCDPQVLFAGTFDRIQRQIFDQSCAVASCHDSQSQSGGLLLETGAALTNLVDHVAVNGAAATAGWLRVSTTAATPAENLATSFLWHKLEGTLPDASYGARMPRDRPKLHPTLRAIIRRWIEAGSPAGGWVPGTF